MSKITLHREQPLTTAVPNGFIDNYMTKANGEYVKVYLYLLRSFQDPSSTVSLARLADHFDCTEGDILRALRYWERLQLFRLEFDESRKLCGIHFVEAAADAPAAQNGAVASPATVSAFCEKEEVKELVFIAEQYLGRTLNHSDLSTIFFWHKELSLSCELIEYLIESCVSKNHTSLRYMQKIAEDYAAQSIHTIEEAKLYNTQHSAVYFAVVNAFGIRGRHLAPAELAFVNQWSTKMGFSVELICEACARTIRAVHEANFGYTNSILKSWYAQGVKTMEEVAAADAAHAKTQELPKRRSTAAGATANTSNRFINFKQRDNNYDEIQKRLVQNSLQ